MYLFPTRMSPQGAFNSALEFVRRDERVIARFGEPLKGYGRDLNTRSEGRRNFIDSKEYVAKDGSKRLRIKFTIEGPGNAKGNVWAEISDKMRSDEWVYLVVRDRRTGELDILIDNRLQMLGSRCPNQPTRLCYPAVFQVQRKLLERAEC